MFKVGQKVVCITNDLDEVESIFPTPTVVGEIYEVIESIYYSDCPKPDYWLKLKGISLYVKSKRFAIVEDNFAEEVLHNILDKVKEEQLELA